MQDVARTAGVSLGTVSNVLNHPAKVSADTIERVRQAIHQLGFVRNDAARSLAAGSSRSLGLVLADIENSLFIDMSHGAQQAAQESGLSLLLGNAACDLRQQDDYLDLFDEARVAGVLLAPMEDSTVGIERMRAHGRQIVLLNYLPDNDDCCAVVVDNEGVGFMAARHLIELGRRRLAFVAGHDSYQPVHDRRLGIQRAIRETNGDVALEEIDSGGLEYEHGLAVGERLLSADRHTMPDGIVVVTDALGNGLIQALHAHPAVRVPEDVAVVGCENNRAAWSGPVPLTTIGAPGRQMGMEATRLLLSEIQSDGTHTHRIVTLQATLIVRASTSRSLQTAGRWSAADH
jgi:LacI family transcriptional regulator